MGEELPFKRWFPLPWIGGVGGWFLGTLQRYLICQAWPCSCLATKTGHLCFSPVASGGHSAGGLGLIGHLSAFYMDLENELNSSGMIGTLGTFLFLGTFLCHQGDVRESSWLCLVCLFSCVLYLAKSSLALKIGFSWKRKHPPFFGGFKEYGCSH